VLINNAGVSSKARSVTEVDAAELAHAFAVNASAAVLVVKALLPNLRAGKQKLIVNITSQLGSIANNSGGSTYGYRASKAALNMFTVCLSNELKGEGFTVVAIHPGWVRTDMGGKNATLSVEESVGAILKTIGALRDEDTGRFLNYDGTGLPW
jgi:NAD(P)-dependent dehydrogenase (short-subunit alcohol dehydrogenase family)